MRTFLTRILPLLLCALCASVVNPLLLTHAEEPLPDIARLQSSPVLRHLKKNPFPGEPKTAAEQTVAFTFDERGRIWVAEAYSYPTKRPPGEGLDKIVIFEDKDGDGKFETRKVFAEGLNLVSALEVGYGGVWVGAAPELFFIPDRNHDDIPDSKPEVLLDGFGYQDTHECLNSFIWGPDGWLYGNQGVFNLAHIGKPGAPASERTELRAGVWRYHPVRHKFEVFARGGSNPWGLDYDEHGQFFMTHCRSYWGRGMTTHVIQGGEYWNQANANYSPYILADPPADFPELKNYLLASADHDHGAGGAGARGTDAIYGGHSHVATMIYYGDNWPEEYRGHLFTHNLGGHQINQEINQPLGSGYKTVHGENDMLFCTDPTYVAVGMKYGPDGAVYFTDWSDQQHCHNPNTEKWDRTNGRMYRMVWEKTYKPVKVQFLRNSLADWMSWLDAKNDWYSRTALRKIHELAIPENRNDTSRPVLNFREQNTREIAQLEKFILETNNPADSRLKRLWACYLLLEPAGFESVLLETCLKDPNEFLRAWAVRFVSEQANTQSFQSQLVELAKSDASPIVRLQLASAIQSLDYLTALNVARALVLHREDSNDRNIPKLLFQSIAQRMPETGGIPTDSLDPKARAFIVKTPVNWLDLVKTSKISQLSNWLLWYAATQDGTGVASILMQVEKANGADQRRYLSILLHAVSAQSDVRAPGMWSDLSKALYSNNDPRIVRLAESIGAAMGDHSRFAILHKTLQDSNAKSDDRKHAFAVLTRAQDTESLPTFLQLLDDKNFKSTVIPQLARYDSQEIPRLLISHFPGFNSNDRAAALNVLTARPAYALALLDAVAASKIGRDQLSAFQIRQLQQLDNAEVEKRAAAVWGRFNKTSAEKKSQIAALEKTFNEAPLWAYSAQAGREHFKKLCAQCHKLGDDGVQFGPELTGASRHGITYFLENIIDPNAVVGADFQMTNIETKDGETITGLLAAETDTTLTIRNQTEKRTLPKDKIATRALSDKSIMPEGLLDTLQPREVLELLKYLTAK